MHVKWHSVTGNAHKLLEAINRNKKTVQYRVRSFKL